jgi:hypothetical protein
VGESVMELVVDSVVRVSGFEITCLCVCLGGWCRGSATPRVEPNISPLDA